MAKENEVKIMSTIQVHGTSKKSNEVDAPRLDKSQAKLNKGIVNVNELLESISGHHFLPLNWKIAFLNKSFQGSLNIHSNEERLFQLFSYLIEKAKKVFPEGTPNIEIGAIEEQQHVIFYVTFRGLELPAEIKEALSHELFTFQIDKDRRVESGPSLAICKEIVEEMHGRLWLQYKKGVNGTLYFTIPK